MQNKSIVAYTDGSCHTRLKTGAWASIIILGAEKIKLSGIVQNTTHNRMEITACIETIEYILKEKTDFKEIHIYTDSQYVVGLLERKKKLKAANFITKKGNSIQNPDLVQKIIYLIENYHVKLIKVKAHQKENETENPNIEVDKMVRRLLRQNLKENSTI
jgi:ribonuclease HI